MDKAVQSKSTSKKKKEPLWTPSVQALVLTAFLFLFITALQVVGAQVSHSRALLIDCISMGVDGFTCLLNAFVECQKRDGGEHLASQLVVAAISLTALSYFTVDQLNGSVETVRHCHRGGAAAAGGEGSEEEEVNGWIVLGFAL